MDVRAAGSASASAVSPPSLEGPLCSSFDYAAMGRGGVAARLIKWLLDDPQWWMGLLRRFWPIPRLPFIRWALVTRFEHVQEVLQHDQVFQVPFGRNMMALTTGSNFVLGMQNGPEYRRNYTQLAQAFRREDVARIVGPRSAEFAEEIVAGCGGRLDAIEELIVRVPTLVCGSYYGIDIPDPRLFAQWSIAMSGFLFGPPSDKSPDDALAFAARNCFLPVVDRSIQEAKAGRKPGTVLGRLAAMQAQGDEGLTDEVIRADLFGMVTGFVPTNTMAAGHMLETLLRRPEFMAQAQAAALAGEDTLLWRCLSETLRFWPINPGPFRVCAQDYTIAAGTPQAKTIRAGTRMLVSTQSAMFDERRVEKPAEFNPQRPRYEYMLFGYGLHWCLGAYIAQAQITQTFKALLRRNALRRADGSDGQLQRVSLFPAHLVVEFDR